MIYAAAPLEIEGPREHRQLLWVSIRMNAAPKTIHFCRYVNKIVDNPLIGIDGFSIDYAPKEGGFRAKTFPLVKGHRGRRRLILKRLAGFGIGGSGGFRSADIRFCLNGTRRRVSVRRF
jgi:hypothetical protein